MSTLSSERVGAGRVGSGRVGSGWSGLEPSGSERGEVRGAGPRVCGLSSARDRARLRERRAAERARVERVLARGPREPVRRRERDDAVACRVCGSERVVEDEVSDGFRWRLAQCLRCEYRWTERGGEGFRPLVRRPMGAQHANGA